MTSNHNFMMQMRTMVGGMGMKTGDMGMLFNSHFLHESNPISFQKRIQRTTDEQYQNYKDA